MNLFSLETGNLMLDGGAMFGVVPKSIWSKKYPVNNDNLCNLCMRCLLIETEDRLLIIDVGMGNTMPENLLKYYYCNGNDTLSNSLLKAGFSAKDVTDVILTHLHFDHCGGAVTKQSNNDVTLTFPNAQYWISKQQWETAHNPNRRERPSFLKDNINPIKNSGRLQLIDKDTEIIPGVELKLFYGHTAGQIMPHITYKNKTLVYCADVIPTAAHIPLSFVCGYDVEPLITLEETELFLQEAIHKNYTLYFEHDIQVECCSLIKTEKGIVLDKTFSLKEFCE